MTKSDENFAKRLDFKNIKFPAKSRDIHKIEKRISSSLAFVVLKMKSKQRWEEKRVDILLIGEGQKNIMSLSKISPDSCMIIYYIVEENIFVVFVYTLLSQTKLKCHIKDSFKINGKQTIKMPKNM